MSLPGWHTFIHTVSDMKISRKKIFIYHLSTILSLRCTILVGAYNPPIRMGGTAGTIGWKRLVETAGTAESGPSQLELCLPAGTVPSHPQPSKRAELFV